MGKENNTRTLNNSSYTGKKLTKKSSKKSSKKKSKKNKNYRNTASTEEMLNIINSSDKSENQFQNKQFQNNQQFQNPQFQNNQQFQNGQQFQNQQFQNPQFQNAQQFQNELGSENFMNMNQQNMIQPNMNQMDALSPSNYESHMLQQMAPLQTEQNYQNLGMGNLMQQNNILSNMSALNNIPNISGSNNNQLMSGPNTPSVARLLSGPNTPMSQNGTPSALNMWSNLNAMSGGKILKKNWVYANK